MPEINDIELLRLFRDREQRDHAFDLIVKKYQEKLYWHIRKLVICHDDADDVLQNTFFKAWKGLLKFREEAQLYTWLYRIATNESLTFLKNKRKRFFSSVEDVQNQLSDSLESDEYFTGDEIQRKLQNAILRLPDKQRLVFNMKYFDNIKYDDMAKILNNSVGALKASYHHAVKKIEGYLKND